MSPHPSNFVVNYEGLLPDARLVRRGEKLWNQLSMTPCSSIRRISTTAAEQKANYRFLNNDRVTEEAFSREAARRIQAMSGGRHLLCIQDTSEINLGRHKGRLAPNSGLGASDNADSEHCFKLHPGLVVDAQTMNPLGFSAIKVFARPVDRPNKTQRDYARQPIEQKESYKWIEVAQRSKKVLKQAASLTFIEDREGDIYEQFARVPDDSVHLLVRSRTTRKLAGGKDLYEQLAGCEPAGSYCVKLLTDKRTQQFKRTATLELRYLSARLQRPANLRGENCPETIEVTCIGVKETDQNVANPVDWKLITTHQPENFAQALQLVEWYSRRWYIEQLFRLLKKQGFEIEQAQLESGWAIRKLAVMQLTALLKILQMNMAYNQPEEEEGQPLEEVFDSEQIQALQLANKKLQGKTSKQQNQNDPHQLKWAAWIVGRLGGWKGYDSQGPPGVVTLKRGLDKLNHLVEGIQLAKDVSTQ